VMLREAIESQFDGTVEEEPVISGRAARRKAGYAAAVANHSDWRRRLDGTRRPLDPVAI